MPRPTGREMIRTGQSCPFLRFTARSGVAVMLAALSLAEQLAAGEGMIRTRAGKTHRGEVAFDDTGRLVVRSAGKEETSVDWESVAAARFAPGLFRVAGSLLPNGWALRDLGGARGMARLDDDVFTMRVEGQSTNATAGHFALRPIASDGEIVARVDHVSGGGGSLAGITLRASRGSSVFASLSLSGNGRILFHRRLGEDATTSRLTSGASAQAPVWLRLQKRDRDVVASCSTNGTQWERVGSDTTTSWVLQRTWREHQGDMPLLRGWAGVFASSLGRDVISTARVSAVSITVDGLQGDYFEGREWERPAFARIDPRVHFNWRGSTPDLSLKKSDFSVRWTGRLLPNVSGEHRFFLDVDGTARLWLNEKEVTTGTTRRPAREPVPVMLRVGAPAELKLEFQPNSDSAAVRLSWAAGAQAEPEIIPMTNFVWSFAATNAPERVAILRATNDLPSVRGVWLRSGTFLAGSPGRGDASAVRLSVPGRKDVSILNSKIARVVFRPQHAVPFEMAQGRAGLFLTDGDFFEGEFQRLEHGSVTLSSVLFGPKRFRAEDGDAAILVLNELAPATHAWRVRLLNGSSLHVSSLSCREGVVTVQEPLLGPLSFPSGDLFEVERIAAMAARP